MKVLDFIRSNKNWEELLAAEPYFIKATWNGSYVLLKYNQFASDFTNEIVRECRGCIFYIPKGHHNFVDIVCYPFEKFGNYGESYVPNIDWKSARVLEKIDGSLIKCWYHMGGWHISTNGSIDAYNAPTQVENVSFYDVFMRALEKNGNPQDFFSSLDLDYTYMFELVSPETRVTIEYPETALYYLGARNMLHFNEVSYPQLTIDSKFFPFIKLPKEYCLSTLKDCVQAANKMGANEEGFVVCDKFFNRIKIKSPEYLLASKVRNNNTITIKHVIEAIRKNYLDDFYAYAPDYRDFIDSILSTYHSIATKCNDWYLTSIDKEDNNSELKYYQIVLKEIPKEFQDYCFKRNKNEVKDAYEYLEKLRFSRLTDWVQHNIKDC